MELCKAISSHFDFISTGNTANHLQSAKIPITPVSEFTGFPEILDGRVKTLHPFLLGGILGRADQIDEMSKFKIQPISLVVVNLYPFEDVISRSHTHEEAIENIDIGGVTLLRAAAKNYSNVLVLSSPDDYLEVATAIVDDEITGTIPQ